MPHTSSVPLSWRLRKSRYCLIGTFCPTCSEVFFPPRALCPTCGKKGTIKEQCLSGLGEVLSFTKINAAPKGFENQAPYIIGVIKLGDGPVITAQIVKTTETDLVGKRVAPVFRKITEDGDDGLIVYGLKFRVVE